MQPLAEPISRLVDAFARLPGIGPKTASRLAFYLLRAPDEQVMELATALAELKQRTVYCEVCQNIAEKSPCSICADANRDQHVLCVVEDPLDVLAIERTGAYRGLYHVLHGVLSPVDGIGPEQLKIAELVSRVNGTAVQELILATNPNLEGEVTAMHIARLVARNQLKITRLARGLPAGGDLEYADEDTLSRALQGRSEM